MNLYQVLNQGYREFKLKETLVETETPKKSKLVKEAIEDIEAPRAEDLIADDNNAILAELNSISDRISSINDAMETAAPDELESLEAEKKELAAKVEELEAQINPITDAEKVEDCGSNCVKEDEEVEVEEVTTEPVEEPTENVDLVGMTKDLASHGADEFTVALEELPEEDKEAFKNSILAIKDIANSLFPEVEEVEEANTPATDEIQDAEEDKLTECEVSNFKVIRKAPKASAYMIEAQTKEGIKYITGKNYDEDSKTLDEAEIALSKKEATDRFKGLLENK